MKSSSHHGRVFLRVAAVSVIGGGASAPTGGAKASGFDWRRAATTPGVETMGESCMVTGATGGTCATGATAGVCGVVSGAGGCEGVFALVACGRLWVAADAGAGSDALNAGYFPAVFTGGG